MLLATNMQDMDPSSELRLECIHKQITAKQLVKADTRQQIIIGEKMML